MNQNVRLPRNVAQGAAASGGVSQSRNSLPRPAPLSKPQTLSPLSAPTSVLVAAVWVVEEMGEMVQATQVGDSGMVLDAVLDTLGILFEVLALPELAPAVPAAYAAYVKAQTDRGRTTHMPHQYVMAPLMQSWPQAYSKAMSPADAATAARGLFSHRASRGNPEDLRELARSVSSLAANLKSRARAAETQREDAELALAAHTPETTPASTTPESLPTDGVSSR